MKQPVVIIGIGEIGGVLARGFLRKGYPVFPVTRDTSLSRELDQIPEPELVVIAVGEKSLHPVMQGLPLAWRHRCLLIQNELLPSDWERESLDHPTVMSVWFEKKPGQDVRQIIPTPVYGPHASQVIEALAAVGIDSIQLPDADTLLFELVRKNLYILTTNICGLEVGGNVGELEKTHLTLLNQVAGEVIQLQEALTGQQFDHNALMSAMHTAFSGDPEHRCQGRSSADRLRRALALAHKTRLDLPVLENLASRHVTS